MTEALTALEPTFADAIVGDHGRDRLVRRNPPALAVVIAGDRQGV